MYINKYDEKWWCPFYKDDEDGDVYLCYGENNVDVYLYLMMKMVTFNYGDDYLNCGDDIMMYIYIWW